MPNRASMMGAMGLRKMGDMMPAMKQNPAMTPKAVLSEAPMAGMTPMAPKNQMPAMQRGIGATKMGGMLGNAAAKANRQATMANNLAALSGNTAANASRESALSNMMQSLKKGR